MTEENMALVPEVVDERTDEAIDRALVKVEGLRAELAKCDSIPEANAYRDKFTACHALAKHRGAKLEFLNDLAYGKLLCERRCGVLLPEIMPGRGRPKIDDDRGETVFERLDITRNDSSRWQREAIVPEDTFETWASEMRALGVELTTSALLKLAKTIQTKEDREKLAEETARLKEEMDADDAVIYDLSKADRLFGMVRSLYADPPWQYNDKGIDGAAEKQYPTMSVDDLCTMKNDVKHLCHKDGTFFWLWTTWPMIRDGAPQAVLESWGFEWKGEIVWNKMLAGMGRWLRVQTEICILATRGHPKKMRDDLPGYLESKRGKHSEKPVAMYDAIETFGAGEYLELFHRGTRRDGWNVFGNAEQKQER